MNITAPPFNTSPDGIAKTVKSDQNIAKEKRPTENRFSYRESS